MTPLLEIHNATVFRDGHQVFSALDLSIPVGCHAAVLGPNGSGKSTLLKLLTRELYPVASPDSQVRVLGKTRWDIWELRSRLGLLSHDLQLAYPGHATGLEVALSGYFSSAGIWEPERVRDEQRSRAADLLTFLDVGHLAQRRFSAMSTGEQRRCLLARALVHRPETLVLDEPTSGLDLKACFLYLDVLRRLMADGTSVVVVTHHIHEIPPEVDHLILLKDGKVFAEGDRARLLREEVLSDLFETAIHLVSLNGYDHALPGTTDSP